ncbi:histidine utilization repressor [Luteimonas mephitis]|uniref:histidine utilization repressor n=1 Tax=Luteimonas mephitis TaxID=83615 RepID=UPI00055B44C8|nr:histidine utilization repressor [Luteimonas mephitis]
MEKPKPQYAKLKHYVLQQITSGKWPPHSQIPSENELVAQFDVSRMTVNRALRELTDSGVVTRVQGVGSFVALPKVDSPMFEVRSIRDEIRARGQTHVVNVLTRELVVARAPIARRFDLPIGSSLFHSRLLHFTDNTPLQLEERFVNPACAPGYLDIDFMVEIPHEYLTRVAPLERTEHEIEAEVANAKIAKTLHIEAGDPLLILSRRTWSRGRVASLVRLTHPAAIYRFVGTFQVGKGSQS